MIKKTKPLADPVNEPTLDMSSMIDVSFLLLVFFLITSTLDPKESDLGMALPTEKKDLTENLVQDIDPMTIRIQADGSIMVEKDILDTDLSFRNLPLLNDKLSTYKSASDLLDTTPLVRVIANDEVPGQRFVDVLNALAKVDIKSVTIDGVTSDN